MLRMDGGMTTLGLAGPSLKSVVLLTAHEGGPTLPMRDADGFRTFLGTAFSLLIHSTKHS